MTIALAIISSVLLVAAVALILWLSRFARDTEEAADEDNDDWHDLK